MATVRIGKQLLEDVNNNIVNFADKIQRDTIAPIVPEFEGTICNQAYLEYGLDALWDEHKHLRDVVPDAWCVFADRIDLHFRFENGPRYTVRVTPRAGKVKNVPKGQAYSPDVIVPVGEDTPEVFRDLVARITEYQTKLKEHVDKFRALRLQVKDFLEASKSLNDALKHYPDLALWIPRHYIDQVERKVERTPADKKVSTPSATADKLASIDTNLITSMGVMRTIAAA